MQRWLRILQVLLNYLICTITTITKNRRKGRPYLLCLVFILIKISILSLKEWHQWHWRRAIYHSYLNICPPVFKRRVGLVCHVSVEVCQLEIRLCPIQSLQSWHRGQCKNLLSFHSFLNVPVNYRRQLEVVVSDMYLFHNCQDMEFYNALLLLSNHLSWLPAFVFV